MTHFRQRALEVLKFEWGTYVKRFNRLPADEGMRRVNAQGYARFRDMLAHILAWWEECMPTMMAIAENRGYERKKYDFDVFNAAAVERYKDWDEQKFLEHFEATWQKCAADLGSVSDAAWEDPRLRGWFHAVFIHHAREHLVALSRFLALDVLTHEWATYPQDFEKVEDKSAFLKDQGVESFRELLAHIIGWWEEGARIINGILYEKDFRWTDPDTDAFNTELRKKCASWSEAETLQHYEKTRAALIDLVSKIPDEAFLNLDIESWLASDVVKHYDDHSPNV